ncbi:MAG TPA: zinc ribbon domain-containing protein, partial [Candidatus Lokiarchaeia archaeon]
MAKYCVYCGKQIKETDKFCISCGKPLLTNLPKSEKESKQSIAPKKEEKIEDLSERDKKKKDKKGKEKEKEEEKEEVSEGIKEEEENKEKEKEKEKDVEGEEIPEELEEEEIENKKKKELKKKKEIKPLTEEVKMQIETHLELVEIREKKKSLLEKLDEFQKLLKSPQYDVDFEFGEKVNVQLQAIKTLIEEVKQKENELKQKIEGKFIVEKLNTDIAVKRDQLENLMRDHKLKKIRDKDVVMKLRDKYKEQLADLTEQKEDLDAGINLWIE